jgi:hypothetical protein
MCDAGLTQQNQRLESQVRELGMLLQRARMLLLLLLLLLLLPPH